MAQRLTLISDATKEFPDNTNNSYRMRIPNGLRLEGKGWHVALLSLSLPNRTLHRFAKGHGNTIARMKWSAFGFKGYDSSAKKYTAVDFLQFDATIHESDVASATDGPSFWKNMIRAFDLDVNAKTTANRRAVNRYLFVKNTMCPTFQWDGDDLVVNKRGRDVTNDDQNHTALYSAFDIALEVAVQWGLVQQASNGAWVIGPNLVLSLFGGGDKLTASDPPRSDSIVAPQGVGRTMLGPTFRIDYRNDIPVRFGHITAVGAGDRFDLMWQYTSGSEQWIRLSGMIEWRFINLNRTYTALHKHPNHSVMVYTNLQQSTIVGERTVQLLREIAMSGSDEEGHSYTEPKHLQWIPIASRHMDIAEVQLADVNGALLSLPPGKSLVTVAFKQMV